MSGLRQLPQTCRDISTHLEPLRDKGIRVAFQPGFPRNWGESLTNLAENGILRIFFLKNIPLNKAGIGKVSGCDRVTLLLHFALACNFFAEDGSIELLAQTNELLQGFQPNQWCGSIQLGALNQNQPIGDYWIFEQQIEFNAIAQPSYNAPTNKEPLLIETNVTRQLI